MNRTEKFLLEQKFLKIENILIHLREDIELLQAKIRTMEKQD